MAPLHSPRLPSLWCLPAQVFYSSPFTGRIILPSILVFALALASLSRLGPNIRQFYFTFFVLGLVANGTAQFAYTRTVLSWFHKRRGLALAIVLTGSGVGSIVFLRLLSGRSSTMDGATPI